MTEPLSNIDRYPDVSAEIGTFLESLTDQDGKSLSQITFAIFGPEVILGFEYAEMLKQIYAAGLFVVDFRIGVLNEEEIESLYKYHVPDSLLSALEERATGNDSAFLLKSVPVRNWRLLRRRYALGPSLVAMLRKPGGSASAALGALKGPSDAVDLESGYLRSGNDNPCFCGIHSSDDSVSVVREAKIFFGEQRLREAIRREKGFSCSDLIEVLDAFAPDPREFRSSVVFVKVKSRLRYMSQSAPQELQTIYQDCLSKMLITRYAPELLRLLTQCIDEERQCFKERSGHPVDEAVAILHALIDPARVRSTGIEILMKSPIMSQVILSEQERLLFETAIAYYREFSP